MTAMTAATLDTLSAGRFRLGLGVSGPQVSEGWHGVPFDAPLGRTREYVAIVRKALTRERRHLRRQALQLPLPDGPGKPLKLTVHPVREHIPLYLAAIGPKNLELTGEIADGWLAVFFSPEHAASTWRTSRPAGPRPARRPGRLRRRPDGPHRRSTTTSSCCRRPRPLVRGAVHRRHGQQGQNFYNQLACRMGYEKEADEIQQRYLAKDYAGAAAAVPLEFIDRTA